MMAMLGHWLGLDSSRTASPPSSAKPRTPARADAAMRGKHAALTIHSSSTSSSAPPAPSSSSQSSSPAAAATKSDQLLRDFELINFLCDVDQRLKEHGQLLPPHDLQRLQALHAQASVDSCGALADIVEHFEEQHERLRHRLAVSSPNSAANDAARARWMTVF